MLKKIFFYFIIVFLLFGIFRFFDYFFFVSLKDMIKESVVKYPPNSEFISTTSDFVYLSETNSLGIRNKELATKTKPRILFFGDSFIYGVGVESENTMVERIAKEFEISNLNYELINAGVIGTCPKQAIELYKDIQEKIQPDVVVLNIYTNDVYESGEDIIARRTREHFIKQRKWIRYLSYVFPRSVDIAIRYYQKKYFGASQSDSLSTIKLSQKYDKLKKQKYQKSLPPKVEMETNLNQFLIATQYMSEHLGIKPDVFLNWKEKVGNEILMEAANGRVSSVHALFGLYDPDYYKDSLEIPDSTQQNLEILIDSIEKFRKQTQNNNQKLILTYIPSELQYDKTKHLLNERLGYHVREDWLLKESPLEQKLSDYAKFKNLPFISLTDEFRNNSGKGLTWPFDIHWNEKGNQVAADALSPFLKSVLLRKE